MQDVREKESLYSFVSDMIAVMNKVNNNTQPSYPFFAETKLIFLR